MSSFLVVLKDVSAIAGAILSPAIGAVAALWVYRRQQRERLHAAIIWGWGTDHISGQPEEMPFLVLQNVSEYPVAISHVDYLRGSVWRKREPGTAIEWDDITDLHFPYEIAPSKTHRFRLNAWAAKQVTDNATSLDKCFRSLGVAPIWIEVRTMGGTRLRLRAEDATPWRDRATWLGGV